MNKTDWTDRRLRNLFQRYNRRYWDGKLNHYSVRIGDLSDRSILGCCYYKKLEIVLDVSAHASDAEIRSTLLHEMAHASERSASGHHGDSFFEQIEHLLRQGAPIKLTMSEMPGHHLATSAVPLKFPLCRKAAERIEARRVAEMDPLLKGREVDAIAESDIIGEFAGAAFDCTWEVAKRVLGVRNGLIDIEGRPVSDWAAKILGQAKIAFGKTRRVHLANRKMQQEIESRQCEVRIVEINLSTLRNRHGQACST